MGSNRAQVPSLEYLHLQPIDLVLSQGHCVFNLGLVANVEHSHSAVTAQSQAQSQAHHRQVTVTGTAQRQHGHSSLTWFSMSQHSHSTVTGTVAGTSQAHHSHRHNTATSRSQQSHLVLDVGVLGHFDPILPASLEPNHLGAYRHKFGHHIGLQSPISIQ